MYIFSLIRRDDPPPRIPGSAYGYDQSEFLKSVPDDCPQELLDVCCDFLKNKCFPLTVF